MSTEAHAEVTLFIREDVGSDLEYPEISAPQAAIVRELVRRGTLTPDETV